MPHLGLVCLSSDRAVCFRGITRKRFLTMSPARRRDALYELFWENLNRLNRALTYCHHRKIHLYRVISSLFPMTDEPLGAGVLREFSANLSAIGRRAKRLRIRLTLHPDQFVVLNSNSPRVVAASVKILAKQALWFDLMGLPRTCWSAITLHGGKSGQSDRLIRAVRRLPANVRRRLVLENDEYAYGAEEILAICRRAGVPMVFDAHHHVVKEKLSSYDDASVAHFVQAARRTWPEPSWQIVHLSNGQDSFTDPRHADFIRAVPAAYRRVEWIEVEARAKERAIQRLRASCSL